VSEPGKLRRAASAAVEAVLDMIYPRTCAACGRHLGEPEYPHLCGECLVKIRWIDDACERCGLPLGPHAERHDGRWCPSCRTLTLGFHRCLAAAVYEEPVKGVVLGLKYGRRMHLRSTLGELVARRLRRSLVDQAPPDCIVPVPLHRKRRRERGFDQAELLAEYVASAAGLPLVGALTRLRYTGAQAALSRTARFENLRGAFECSRPKAVAGRRVLLVDDVMTTGATASAAARALREGGAAHVTAAVAARALRG